MKVLNSLITLVVLGLIGAGLFLGWQFYNDCQANGRTTMGTCIFGDPVGDVVDEIDKTIEDVGEVIEDVGEVIDDVGEDVGEVVEDVGEVVDDVGEDVGEVVDDGIDLVSNQSCSDTYGPGANQHINGSCYACPEGHEFFWDAASDAACKPIGFEQISEAIFIGSSDCGTAYPGSFLDPRNGGECWSCPTGYSRTLSAVTASDACIASKTQAATYHGSATGFLGTDCSPGQFWDPNGNCYSCPEGLNRTLAAVTATDACQGDDRKPATHHGSGGLACQAGAFYDPRNGGECWSCPSGFNRSLAPVTAKNACSRSTLEDTTAAINLGVPSK